jgi:uncharacterized phage protein (TIGR01671 family)
MKGREMREIEFRGKATYTGKWVYGDLLTKEIDTPEDRVTGFVGIQMDSGPASGGFFYVPLETVGQYTGLKDRNGVKIFEGDIVKIDNNVEEETIIGFVVHEYASWQIDCGPELISLYQHHSELEEYQTVEIIGNIHDTPELLENVL